LAGKREKPVRAVKLFCSYSHRDEDYLHQFETHLAMLKREGWISLWTDRRMLGGGHIDSAIDTALLSSDLIAFLVSPDFLASDYAYGIELASALLRHQTGEGWILPVILRPCDWRVSPLGQLNALPRDGKPISQWQSSDDAWLDVVRGLRLVIEHLNNHSAPR
jgi:hypothetical protein